MHKITILFTLIVGLLSSSLQAAGPVMHVILGERWLALNAPQYTPEEKKLFLLGTVFPDIRYLGVIKRKETHYKNMTLAKVSQANTPFERGMLFHSFVDEFRDKFILKVGIREKTPEVPSKLKATFLKLVEDQILHEKYDWSDFRASLVTVPKEESDWNIPATSLAQWHTALTLYFSALPSFLLNQVNLFQQGILVLDASTVSLWTTLLPQYAADAYFQEYVQTMLNAFDKALTSTS